LTSCRDRHKCFAPRGALALKSSIVKRGASQETEST
jgi:hypothetical protein